MSCVIESLQQQRPIKPTTLPFYLRSKNDIDVKAGKFKLVKIQLNDKVNLKTTIISILKSCNLPTTFVDKIEKPPNEDENKNKFYKTADRFSDLEDDPLFQSIFMRRKMDAEPDTFK